MKALQSMIILLFLKGVTTLIKVKTLRVSESDEGTFGTMTIDGHAFCCTLEPPDRDNKKNVSSIPAGKYVCRRVMSPKYGDTFEITDVPNRTHVLFHPGNVVKHTRGCVILGQHYGKLYGDRAVLNSGKTFKSFMYALKDVDSFDYEVVDSYKDED